MRKKRIYNGNKGINPAALVVFLLCLGLYWLHFSAYYKNGGSVYDALLFTEFPYIHGGIGQSTAPAPKPPRAAERRYKDRSHIH